ncbi:MAG TPA: molybdopterin dinucleotide binding domain-containing protein [Anaerolineae bacterium]|nr:molybdopterin dinucleotide binding domain-containing protein [Anaerolineae bacterium]
MPHPPNLPPHKIPKKTYPIRPHQNPQSCPLSPISWSQALDDIASQLNHIITQHGPRASLHLSVGINQGPFGTLCAIASQLLLYLTGNFDQTGGILFHPLAPWLDWFNQLAPQPYTSRIGRHRSIGQMMTAGILADEILTPGSDKIRALIVLAGNPLTSIPGQDHLHHAFQQLDLLVTHDLFVNDTGALAHYQLPATSWLERADVAAWHMPFFNTKFLPFAAPVQPPPGTAWTEAQFLTQLARRLGHPLFNSRPLNHLLGHPRLNHWLPKLWPTINRPFRHRWQDAHGLPFPSPQPGYFNHRPVHFWHPRLDPEIDRLHHYAAQLTTTNNNNNPNTHTFTILGRRRRRAQNSWLHGGTHNGTPDNTAYLHPADMAALDLTKHDHVHLTTHLGHLTIKVAPDDGTPRHTIIIPHGLPNQNINALYPTILEPISGMHLLHGHTATLTIP